MWENVDKSMLAPNMFYLTLYKAYKKFSDFAFYHKTLNFKGGNVQKYKYNYNEFILNNLNNEIPTLSTIRYNGLWPYMS